MAFYDKFSELCKQHGVSPSSVAKAIGLTTANPTYWKRGSIPKGDTLQKLADYFGVSVDFLLGKDTLPAPRITSITVGDSYFDGAMEVTQVEEGMSRASIVFEIDEEKMTTDELLSLMKLMEKIAKDNGISITGLSLLADAAAKAVTRSQDAPQSPPAPQEGTNTTPTSNAPETPQDE